jgi:hypothetical protein
MPELGKKYTCYSCHTKFYDLGKPIPLCPKCGADQRDAEDTPIIAPRSRSRAVIEEPAEEPEFPADAETPAGGETDDEEEIAPVREEETADEDEEEEEEY